MMPYGDILLTDAGNNEVGIGSRINLGSSVGLELEGSRNFKVDTPVEKKLKLDGIVNW